MYNSVQLTHLNIIISEIRAFRFNQSFGDSSTFHCHINSIGTRKTVTGSVHIKIVISSNRIRTLSLMQHLKYKSNIQVVRNFLLALYPLYLSIVITSKTFEVQNDSVGISFKKIPVSIVSINKGIHVDRRTFALFYRKKLTEAE